MKETAKDKIEKAYRILYMEGLAEDTFRGHITVRSSDGSIYIKTWGKGFGEVTVGDLLCMDTDGKLLAGVGRLHSETPLHLEIYRKRSDIFSVVHVHPVFSVLLSSVFDGELKVIGQNGIHFWDGIPFYESPELINNEESGKKLAKILGDKQIVLMRNHGIVTVGKSLEEAVILAIDFEKAAKDHLMVSFFEKVRVIPREIAERMRSRLFSEEQYKTMWEFYSRKLEKMNLYCIPQERDSFR